MSQYDYLVVGAGLSGTVFANAAKRAGKSVLVIDRRDHIAGNVYTEDVEGIQVHRYGAHIFHTSMKDVWATSTASPSSTTTSTRRSPTSTATCTTCPST